MLTLTDKAPAKTAAEAYAGHQQDIAAMIEWLLAELDVHAKLAREQPQNWDSVGDLAYVSRQIKEVLVFLAGPDEGEIDQALEELHI